MMIIRLQILVTRRITVAWVKLRETRCTEKIVKLEVLAENSRGVFTSHLKSWN